MCRRLLVQVLMIAPMLVPQFGYAVEAPGLSSRFSLVGIIAAEDRKGKDASLAVIRDEKLSRSIMLRQGESLPGVDGVIVSAIHRSNIELMVDGQITIVNYVGTQAVEEPKEFSPQYMNTEDLEGLYYDRRSSVSDSSEADTDYSYSSPVEVITAPAERASELDDSVSVELNAERMERFQDLGRFGESRNAFVPLEEPRIVRETGGQFNEYSSVDEDSGDEVNVVLGGSDLSEKAQEIAD